MANPDRPNGLRPVGTLDGSPWNARVRKYPVADRSADTTNNHGDLYVGDPVELSSGKVQCADSNDTIAGVVVAVGKEESVNDGVGPYKASDLTQRYAPHADATGWFAYVCPVEGVIFEVQSATDLDYFVGSSADINTAANTAHGSRTTGLSNCEITTASNNDVKVVAIPDYPDNDSTLVNARYHVVFIKTAFEQ